MINHTAIYTDALYKEREKKRKTIYEESKHEITINDVTKFKKGVTFHHH